MYRYVNVETYRDTYIDIFFRCDCRRHGGKAGSQSETEERVERLKCEYGKTTEANALLMPDRGEPHTLKLH